MILIVIVIDINRQSTAYDKPKTTTTGEKQQEVKHHFERSARTTIVIPLPRQKERVKSHPWLQQTD